MHKPAAVALLLCACDIPFVVGAGPAGMLGCRATADTCGDPACEGRSCGPASACSSPTCVSGACVALPSPAGLACAPQSGCSPPQVCGGTALTCSVSDTLFWTSWEDGESLLNTGGCHAWTDVMTPADFELAEPCPVPDFDGQRCLRYGGTSSVDAGVYRLLGSEPRVFARFLLRVAGWVADEGAFRTVFSVTTTALPNHSADETAIYTRLEKFGGATRLDLRTFDGVQWGSVAAFPLADAVTYQVELGYVAASDAGAGVAGWRIWNAAGDTLLASFELPPHSSMRTAAGIFFGSGYSGGVTTSTELYVDALRVDRSGWVGPRR